MQLAAHNFCPVGIGFDCEKRHSPTMDAPQVHTHGVELACNARFEDAGKHACRNTATVVENRDIANFAFLPAGNIDPLRLGISGIAEHLDDDVLALANVMFCLAALCLFAP